MGEIISSYIFPHPPVIIPEIGHGRESGSAKTIEGAIRASKEIANDKPTTVILTSPHAPVFRDYIYISIDRNLSGNMASFGRPDIEMGFENNLELVKKIIEESKAKNILAGGLSASLIKKHNIKTELDHGALVPLYYIRKRLKTFKLIHIAIAGLSNEDLYRFGKCIKDAVISSFERVVFVASGDLSHRLSREAPAGFHRHGKTFDRMLIDRVSKSDVPGILSMNPAICDNAGECGLRSFIIMYGAMDGYDIESEVYSYEGPFGVGYAVAKISNTGVNENKDILAEYKKRKDIEINKTREKEDFYTRLARITLETYIKENKIPEIPEDLPDSMLIDKAGVFVSIKKEGNLRGCIGTISPTTGNIANEIIQNSISAGTKDPRFEPVLEEELDSLKYSVDVLSEPEDIKSKDELDVYKYGIIVKSGLKKGLLLPNLDGIDTTNKQISIALQKAKIDPNEDYKIQRFEVIRHT